MEIFQTSKITYLSVPVISTICNLILWYTHMLDLKKHKNMQEEQTTIKQYQKQHLLRNKGKKKTSKKKHTKVHTDLYRSL